MTQVEYANLIAAGIQAGVAIYNQIRANHPEGGLAPAETLIAAANAKADDITATADAELAKLPPKE